MKQQNKKIKRRLKGTVISNKMNKTVVVKVERFKKHPRYHKTMKISSHFKANDENNECKIGDWVTIEETRPLSKTKRWQVVEFIKKHRDEETNGESESDLIAENQ